MGLLQNGRNFLTPHRPIGGVLIALPTDAWLLTRGATSTRRRESRPYRTDPQIGRPFLLPVVIDGTRDAEAHVPDSFTEVQWTRLRQAYGGQASPASSARRP